MHEKEKVNRAILPIQKQKYVNNSKIGNEKFLLKKWKQALWFRSIV